jgi:adenine-specific DNA-methyltransferase
VKVREEVSADKLRGGFYTPAPLVGHCFDRVRELIGDRTGLSLIEPSAGDGAFFRGLGAAPELAARFDRVQGVELVEEEAQRARSALDTAGLPGSVHGGSAIAWAVDTDDWFDVAVGNPPFVRYQFLPPADRALLRELSERLGVALPGVGNVWIPVLLGALARLRPGGAFACVIPAECFTGISAAVVREWLRLNTGDLRFDLFPPGSFPGVLQEVTVVSGRAAAAVPRPATIGIVEHSAVARARRWGYLLRPGDRTWTRYLLEPPHLAAADAARASPHARRLGELARIEVSIVTGANDFFCVDDATAAEYELWPWARPLLPRGRHAPGLRFTRRDQESTRDSGARSWLLDFGSGSPDPEEHPGASRYLAAGRGAGLHGRYKCRIREPWYRVPSIRSGTLLLSKRSHLLPRLVLNEARSLTTDTIYRGEMLPGARVTASDLVAGFHSSLTLLSAELEGRSFGGGVLELVPTEVGLLSVVAVGGLGEHLPELDRVARGRDPESLVEATDEVLVREGILTPGVAGLVGEARAVLLGRRLERGGAAA